jgi:hypothetical protein
MILGLPLAQVEQQIIAMIAANCNHAPGKIVNRSPPNRAPPHEWRFHRTPRDADAQQQVCAACKQPHDGRVSSYVIKLHTRSAEVHYVCEKTKCSVVIGKIAGASNSHIACGNKRKRGNASEWSYDGNYDRIGQPLAPKALWVEQLAQWRQRAYHDERDEILEAIRSIISPGAILVDTLKEQQQPQTEEEQRRVQCEQRDLLQFRIAADIEIVHTVHIDRGHWPSVDVKRQRRPGHHSPSLR